MGFLLCFREREAAPHFATPGTFEREWAQRWRALEEVEHAQREALDLQFKEAREKLETEMNQAIQEHEAMMARQGTVSMTVWTFHSQEWSISNFLSSLARNITSYSMKNLAFHSLLRWKMIIIPILSTSLIHCSLKGWEIVTYHSDSTFMYASGDVFTNQRTHTCSS